MFLRLGWRPFPVPHIGAHNAVGAAGLDAFEAARPESPARFWPGFIDLADRLPVRQVEVDAMTAIELYIGAAVFGKVALRGQVAGSVPGQKLQLTRIPAETAGAAGHAVKRRIGHVRCRMAPATRLCLSQRSAAARDLRRNRVSGKRDFSEPPPPLPT